MTEGLASPQGFSPTSATPVTPSQVAPMVRHPSPTYERPGAGHRPADPGQRMVGRVLTGNGITRYGEGRDVLLQLCRQRLDALHRLSPRR